MDASGYGAKKGTPVGAALSPMPFLVCVISLATFGLAKDWQRPLDAVVAEPPLRPLLALLVALQALLWRWMYDEHAWPTQRCVAWLRSRPNREASVLANAKAFFAQFGLGPETEDAAFVALWFPAQISVPMHHGAATAFAFSAYSFGSSGLLRVALSFEIAENVLHYAQMAWTALRPDRGVAPWRFCDRKTWAFVGLHHLLGLVAGSAAFLSPSVCAWPELQLFVAMVLAAGLPSFLKLPLQVCADLSQPSLLGVAGAAIDVLGMAFLSWVRLGWGPRCYLPMARALVERCREDEGCAEWFYAVPLYYVFPVFNLMSVVILAPYVFTQVRAQFTGPAPRKLS